MFGRVEGQYTTLPRSKVSYSINFVDWSSIISGNNRIILRTGFLLPFSLFEMSLPFLHQALDLLFFLIDILIAVVPTFHNASGKNSKTFKNLYLYFNETNTHTNIYIYIIAEIPGV